MSPVFVLLFGVGLSADAASVAVCEGMKLKKTNVALCLKIALFFGLFQMLMPLIGFYLGDLLVRIPLLSPAIGWIAFALLLFVSLKMLWEAGRGEDCDCCAQKPVAGTGELLLLAVATSIDAMSVGVGFAAAPPVFAAVSVDLNVLFAAVLIGCVTFTLSFFSALFGRALQRLVAGRAELFGGLVLLALSVKMLLENLGVTLPF